CTLRDLDGQLQLVERKGRLGVAARSPSIVGVELDPLCALADLIANDARQAVDAVRFLRALRRIPLRHELRLIRSCGDDGASGRENPRTGNDVLLDGLLELDVRIARAFSAEITNGCEARLQCRLEMVSRASDAQREAFARHLVHPGRLAV